MFRIKYSREAVLKLLYQEDVLTGNRLDGEDANAEEPDAEALLEKNTDFFRGLNTMERDFILKIVQKVMDEKEAIDGLISRSLIGWKLERLMAVDRCLLRMGIAESFFNDQKPVIIDDVIRIAKKYGGEDSYKIINAILDKVIE